jgi:hypothetical protein
MKTGGPYGAGGAAQSTDKETSGRRVTRFAHGNRGWSGYQRGKGQRTGSSGAECGSHSLIRLSTKCEILWIVNNISVLSLIA